VERFPWKFQRTSKISVVRHDLYFYDNAPWLLNDDQERPYQSDDSGGINRHGFVFAFYFFFSVFSKALS